MLKIVILLALIKPNYIKVNEIELNINANSSIDSSRINNRIKNLLNSMKVKKSFEISYFTFKASLVFLY